ncbi:MAG: methyl-accepting chemotaxis protein [Treponema sp.]|uniref:methyl-accepting chemotaxis protein n=1 Tax=Treponema sp. TaxID=166 RepID=UPI003FA2FF14
MKYVSSKHKNQNRKHFSLSVKLMILIFISINITVVPVLFVINRFIYHTVRTNAIQSATTLSEKYGAVAAAVLKEPFTTAHLLASGILSLESIPPHDRRKALHDLVEKCLAGNNDFFSMWVCYEPNQFDGLDAAYADTPFHDSTGRVVLYFDKDPATKTVNEGILTDYTEEDWYLNSLNTGKDQQFDPYLSLTSASENILVTTFTVPLKNQDGKTVGVFGIDLALSHLAEELSSLKLYETGYGSLLSSSGVIVTEKDKALIGTEKKNFESIIRNFKYNSTDGVSSGAYQNINTAQRDENGKKIFEIVVPVSIHKSFAPWYLVCKVSQAEVYKNVNKVMLITTVAFLLYVVLVIVMLNIIVARKLRPLSNIAAALQDIAQGDGDLTVRLPLISTDEITDISEYFNETITKIGKSVKSIGGNSSAMEEIGAQLASNMTETADAIGQIRTHIEGVKQQAMGQAASVTETAATIEEIVRTIKQLNTRVETQASSVAQSSASVEEMVANIASIGQTLGKSDEVIRTLTAATGDGKAALGTANMVTKKITEESGSLMEASSVIQHIASQTNLLAMNAAIEAAHAGEAGKGFAVVADEIRKLSEDSAMQGKTITATLKNLSGEIETLSNSAKTVEEKFNTIFSLAEQVKKMSAHLTESMREQEHGGRDVLTAIKNINLVTTEVQAGSEEMLEGGKLVAQEMQKLDNIAAAITASMNEMASGAVQITNTVHEVSKITQKNKQSIENLAKEVGKFKV